MTAPQDPPRIAKVAAAIALLAAAGSCGFIAYRLLAVRSSSLTPVQWATSTRSRTAAADSNVSEPPGSGKIPEQIPDFAMPDTGGVVHKLSEWRGRPLLVNFWATWCDPCRREIPLLKSLRREHASESLEIVGVAVDFQDAVIQYTHSIGIDYPVLVGEKDGMAAIEAFGMATVFPFTVFADSQGRILTVKVGELHRDEANVILNGLREVDSGKIDLAAARKRLSSELSRLEAQHSRQG
jgi:thiol-disulfide isomerase/thioredoxin